MSHARVYEIIGALIVGIVLAIIGFIFTQKKTRNVGHRHNGDKGDFIQMKLELERLQKQIAEINREKHAKKSCSTIDSGHDYQTCEELDDTDFDLHSEGSRRDNGNDECEEASEFQEKLNAIDQKLASENKAVIREVLIQLEDLCFNEPEEVELLYRVGQALVKLSEGETDDVAKSYIDKAIEALTAALNLNEKHAEVHKWYAICLGLRSRYQSMTQKAQDGFLFKKHCEVACALNPSDAMLHYLLGRFDYEIAGLGWFGKTAAKAVFGESLNSTYADALNHFMIAERLPTYQNFSIKEKKEHKTMIAKILIAQENQEEAVRSLIQARNLGPADPILDQEVDDLLRQHQ